jgi:hypothetical protein
MNRSGGRSRLEGMIHGMMKTLSSGYGLELRPAFIMTLWRISRGCSCTKIGGVRDTTMLLGVVRGDGGTEAIPEEGIERSTPIGD